MSEFDDLIPVVEGQEQTGNVYQDLIPVETETPVPGFFEGFTDKEVFIGQAPFKEDYEDITDELGGFDKFFYQTLGGNEKVYRQKESGINYEKLRDGILSREAAEIVGAFGGYEGVRRFYQSTASKIFKKNPYIMVASVIGGTLGATGMAQIYDRVKGFITGEEETLEEIYAKIPDDLKRNLSFELFGVAMGSVPFYFKKGMMVARDNIEQLFKSSKRFGGADRIAEIERLLAAGPKSFVEARALKKELKALKDKQVQVAPIDVRGGFAESFLRIGGIFPFVARPIKKFIKKRGERFQQILDDVFYALGPAHNTMSKVGADITKLASEQYLTFRRIVGTEYNKFLDLASGKVGNRVIGFDRNIVPLINRSDAPDKVPYLLDVARKIIKDAQGDGGPLPAELQTEAYKLATLIVKRYGNKQFLDVDFLYNTIMKRNIKDGIERSYATEGGSSVAQLVDLRNAIKAGFENLDQSKIPSDLAEQINAQYKIANNMYKNGFENNGQFFQGIDLYETAMGKSFEKIKSGIFDNRLTKEGKKYYADFIKNIMKFGDPKQAEDLYELIGRDNNAMGALVRTYIDDAFRQATEAVGRVEGEAKRTFNFLRFDPDKFIKALGYRDPISSSKGLTVGGREDALTNILNILNKNTDGKVISGTDFRELLNALSKQGDIPLPDPNQFVKRAAVFGGIYSILGLTIGGLTFGGGASLQASAQAGAGGAGGIGLPFTVAGYLFSNLLANPRNTKYLFESLDSRIPYFKRYSAALRVLDIYKDSLIDGSKDLAGEAKEQADTILDNFMIFYNEAYDNKPNEGDEEPEKFKDYLSNTMQELDEDEVEVREKPEPDLPDIPDDEIIEEDIDTNISVPTPNLNMNLADVVPPIQGPIDPNITKRLSSVGLPLFANEGGIASLMNKPKQMVA